MSAWAACAAAAAMGTTQKYSLKWNDFTVNVASTFRDLHARQDFVDVTLACADGSTLEAHKVVLSSVSSYFRDILKVSGGSFSGDVGFLARI